MLFMRCVLGSGLVVLGVRGVRFVGRSLLGGGRVGGERVRMGRNGDGEVGRTSLD